jgi:hypothetical protein
MTSSVTNPAKRFALIALSLALAAMGIYLARANNALGGAVGGFLPMLAAVLLGVRAARQGLPIWGRRTALAVGVVIAAVAAFLIHAAAVAAPLFAQPQDAPSVSRPLPPPQWAAAVDRARPLVRAAVVDQNLPGVSIAVGLGVGLGDGLGDSVGDGVGDAIVWAEGFGWRDVVTQTPVTPETRFNIGTAARVVTPAAVASLGMTNTGSDSAAEWSPSHNGEPEDDFPPFTLFHDLILRPVGLAGPAQPLPGDRATFYVPRSDDNNPRHGRLLMYMRDLACCADGMAFYSTPSDLVRFALATKAGSVNGELAGGSVMSLMTRRDSGIVVAVTSNIAHADTAALALSVARVFAEQK